MQILTLSDGRRLAYEMSGAGEPLLLVHGSPGDHRAWSRAIRQLPEGFLALVPDLPGYGNSDPPPGAGMHATVGLAEALAQLVNSIGRPVWLAGHSYGGNVALHLASLRPRQVRGLALIDPVFMRALSLIGQTDLLAVTEVFFTGYAAEVAAGNHAAIASMFAFWFGPGSFDTLPPTMREALQKLAPRNAADVQASFDDPLSAATLRSLRFPVRIFHGEHSPPVARAIATALAQLLPDAVADEIPGAGHGMTDTHADQVAMRISHLARPGGRA